MNTKLRLFHTLFRAPKTFSVGFHVIVGLPTLSWMPAFECVGAHPSLFLVQLFTEYGRLAMEQSSGVKPFQVRLCTIPVVFLVYSMKCVCVLC